jgi:DNA-binding beta-propeller fold protein YncE
MNRKPGMRYDKKHIVISIVFIIMHVQHLFSQADITNTFTIHPTSILQVGEYPYKDTTNTLTKNIRAYFFRERTLTLNKPISLIVQSNSTIMIIDQGLKNPVKIKNQTGEIPRAFKKSGFEFPSLVGLCQTDESTFLFTDSYLNGVYAYSEKDGGIKKILSDYTFNQPTGIAYSEMTGELWVVETSAHRISVFNQKGELLKIIGKRGTGAGEFNFPTFIWIDKLGTIYVIDSLNFRVQIFDKGGEFVSLFGEQGDGTGSFARPKGIAVDSWGNIYVCDGLFHTVQIFDREGVFLMNFGKQGRGEGDFWMPTGIFIDEHDRIYIADTYNSRIQIFKFLNEQERHP